MTHLGGAAAFADAIGGIGLPATRRTNEVEIPAAVWTALITTLLSVPATYFAMRSKIRRDLEADYDKDLRERRMTAYAALWALTEPLARYSPPEPLSAHGARLLSKRLRGWYFSDGMVLSAAARDAYFELQKKLVAAPIAAAPAPTRPLDEELVEELRKASSAMRTALSRDVASRRPPMIAAGGG
jgi:hypothetical protein